MESYALTYAASSVHLCLFAVRNAAELRARLVTASQLPDYDEGNEERKAVDFAFIDAKMVSGRCRHRMLMLGRSLPLRN